MEISEIFCTRPEAGSRESVEERSYDLLERLNISFRRVDHDEAASMEALEPTEEKLGTPICKNLFLTNRQQTEFYLLLMPGKKPFKTKFLSKQLNCSRLSFATAEHLDAILDVKPGSASILALENDKNMKVHLVIDSDLEKDELFGCHPCRNTSTLSMNWKDIKEKLIPALKHKPIFVELPWEPEAE